MLSFDDPKLQAELSLFVMQPFYEVPERRPRRADIVQCAKQTQTDLTDKFASQYQTPDKPGGQKKKKKHPPGYVGPRAAATLDGGWMQDVDDDVSDDDPHDEPWSSSMRASKASPRDASTPTTLFASPHTSAVSARAVAARIRRRLGEEAAPAEEAPAAGSGGEGMVRDSQTLVLKQGQSVTFAPTPEVTPPPSSAGAEQQHEQQVRDKGKGKHPRLRSGRTNSSSARQHLDKAKPK
jgi:hypothetical protein